MAKWANDLVMDAALDYLATCTIMFVCSGAGAPATYAAAATSVDLATHVLAAGDFAKADDTSGRKVTIAEQAAITVDHSGDATHVCLGISASSTLVLCTTCTTQTLTAANTVTVPAFKDGFADPT